ncbi:MAG: thrombospondin type 3 repeat-containing protein [Deltaproteobacteria bacterium]|nr:thrombospondin type 3 repeat-containing protein [Deltaproteobacteria bacterium]
MNRLSTSLLLLAAGLSGPLAAQAAPCAPVKTAAELVERVKEGCTPITFDSSIAGKTLTVASTLSLKAWVKLDGETNNVTIAGTDELKTPLIKIANGGVTIRGITLTHPGKIAIFISGASAQNSTITENTITGSGWGVYVSAAKQNRITANAFSGNTTAAIFLSGGNNNLQAPTVQSAQLQSGETAWEVRGTGPAGGTVELYAADPNLPAVPQGKKFLAEAAVDADGNFVVTQPYPAVDPKQAYTLLAIDSTGNTSAFGPVFTPESADFPFFETVDPDGDEKFNSGDNCGQISNPDQADFDSDGVGDICDNCPSTASEEKSQVDADGDGIGDACDPDIDGDQVKNLEDNCPLSGNSNQADEDKDGEGDICDFPSSMLDADEDDILNGADNCVFIVNPEQTDADGDGLGDACDEDLDGDQIGNWQDNCPYASNVDQADVDQNGVGDACMSPGGMPFEGPDTDADTFPDGMDICPKVYNPDQLDADADGLGDACDADRDGDGAPNWSDNCPDVNNQDQTDMNDNKVGDVCDLDTDADAVPDWRDNCDDLPNADQADANANGTGDACEILPGESPEPVGSSCALTASSRTTGRWVEWLGLFIGCGILIGYRARLATVAAGK